MNITLQALTISGFKGINSLAIPFKGADAIISGDNGTGKTSVFGAILYLLTGKDINGAQADVKPVDSNGNRISGKDVDVCAKYLVDGVEYTLRKQLREVWSKPRGGSEAVYERDETLCWINDVPKKIDKEFAPEVASIFGCDDATFKLLSNFRAFMAMGWADRRRSLLKLTGAEVVVPGFERIGDILLGNTPEDAKKRLMEQRKRQSDTLETIPARIDELQRAIRITDADILAEAKKAVAAATAEIESIDGQLTGSDEAGRKINEIISRKTALERRKLTAETMISSDYMGELTTLNAKLRVLESNAKGNTADIAQYKATNDRDAAEYAQHTKTMSVIRAEYDAIQNEAYALPADFETKCPFCKQDLPQDMVEDADRRHRADWNTLRAKRIEENVAKGRIIKAKIEVLSGMMAERDAKIEALEGLAPGNNAEIAKLKEQIAAHEAKGAPVSSVEIEMLKADIAAVDAELNAIGTNEQAEALRQRKRELNAQIALNNGVIAQAGANASNINRIVELEHEKEVAGSVLASIEKSLYTLGQYVSARCRLLEESINGHFELIRWRLFDIQKNGEIRDCCDALVNGVPYGSGLNNAAEVNAGIEIIRVMSGVYNIHMPCFVDNAESVNRVARSGGQMIKLKVTDEPKLTYTLI